MFKNPFSFEGRIHRAEYGFSMLLSIICLLSINLVISETHLPIIFGAFYIPLAWFLCAQGAKRCHDLGKSGWWQIIPLYSVILLFVDGETLMNDYGYDPKITGPILEDFISE